MADIVITPANVVGSGTAINGTSGEAINAGESVYLKAADGRYWRTQSDQTIAEAKARGIALNSAPGAGQPIAIQAQGAITIGGTTVRGQVYVVSTNNGKICPLSDLVSTNYVTLIGVGDDANVIQMGTGIFATGIVK